MKISTFVYTLSALAPALVLGQDSPLVQQAAPAGPVANPAATAPDANVVINNQALPPGLATPPVVVDGAQSPVAAAAAADSPTAGADANPVPTPAMDANAQPLPPSAVNVGAFATQPSENNNSDNNNQALLDTPVLPSADSQVAGMLQPQVPNPSLGSNGLPPVESDASASISDIPLGTPTEPSDISAGSAESGQDSATGFETFGASSLDSDDSNMESDESEFGLEASEGSEESELGSEESGSDDFDSESESDDSTESDESDSTDSDDLSEEISDKSRERDSSSDEFDFSSDEFATDDISSGNAIAAMGFVSLGSALCLAVGAGAFF
ncbi:hypothetical protein IWW48_003950 [Coemansia sp. RSA 1200]|nr:hypothetical protein IWW48_003950 [Coemansia sp. RSA 1200]